MLNIVARRFGMWVQTCQEGDTLRVISIGDWGKALQNSRTKEIYMVQDPNYEAPREEVQEDGELLN